MQEKHFGIYSTYYGCENKNKSSIEKIWVQSMLRIRVTETCLVEQRVPPSSIWVYLNNDLVSNLELALEEDVSSWLETKQGRLIRTLLYRPEDTSSGPDQSV